ncbi:MAG: sugar phosphate isomerase/epimerase family protein [Capsulimonadales bacterium]|nr:sugar phosphate isomerase/epimerase family protein [Capsulimonadales bacterium]
MYVSIRDEMVLSTGFDSLAQGLKFFGLNAVELNVGRDFRVRALTPTEDRPFLYLDRDEDVRQLGEQASASGIRISALLMGNNFNAPDLGTELAWAVRTIRAAADLGIPAVRIDAIMHGERDLPTAQRQDIFARGVRTVLNGTDGLPVDLGIENHGFQGNDPEFLDGLMERVASPRLGMTIDTGNFYWFGYPLERVYEILEKFAPLTKHTHIKNIRYPSEMVHVQRPMGFEYGKYCCPVPEGDIDHGKVVGFLRTAGYERDLCIEDESLGKFDETTRRANIRATVEHLNACLAG